MSFARCPADVIITISSFLDTQTLLRLRLINRILHDIITPYALECMNISLTNKSGGSTQAITKRLQAGTIPLPHLYQHTRRLKVRLSGRYIHHHVPEDLLPDLWRTVSFLRSLKSVDISWDCQHGDTETIRALVRTHLFQVANAVMEATGGRLERLAISPPSGEPIIPAPFLRVRGLVGFRMDYDSPQNWWDCQPSREALDGGDTMGPWTCKCTPLPVDTDIATILAANPTLQELRLRHRRVGKGYSVGRIFTSQMTDLRSISMNGLNLWGMKTLLPAPSLRNLRHVEVSSSYLIHPLDLLWMSMKAANTKLESLTTAQISLSLVNYLTSFSGLRNLKIYDILTHPPCSSPQITSTFIHRALPLHFSTLKTLSFSYSKDIEHIEGWDFDPALWRSFLPKMVALTSLHIPPYAFETTNTRGVEYPNHQHIPMIVSRYQTVLDTVRLAPNIEFFEIYWPNRTFGCGTGALRWKTGCLELLDIAVKELRTSGETPKPKELRLCDSTYLARPVASEMEFWEYVLPASRCSPFEDLFGSLYM